MLSSTSRSRTLKEAFRKLREIIRPAWIVGEEIDKPSGTRARGKLLFLYSIAESDGLTLVEARWEKGGLHFYRHPVVAPGVHALARTIQRGTRTTDVEAAIDLLAPYFLAASDMMCKGEPTARFYVGGKNLGAIAFEVIDGRAVAKTFLGPDSSDPDVRKLITQEELHFGVP